MAEELKSWDQVEALIAELRAALAQARAPQGVTPPPTDRRRLPRSPEVREKIRAALRGAWAKKKAAGAFTPKALQHGRAGTYVRGCRCPECTLAWRYHYHERKAAKMTSAPAMPTGASSEHV